MELAVVVFVVVVDFAIGCQEENGNLFVVAVVVAYFLVFSKLLLLLLFMLELFLSLLMVFLSPCK